MLKWEVWSKMNPLQREEYTYRFKQTDQSERIVAKRVMTDGIFISIGVIIVLCVFIMLATLYQKPELIDAAIKLSRPVTSIIYIYLFIIVITYIIAAITEGMRYNNEKKWLVKEKLIEKKGWSI